MNLVYSVGKWLKYKRPKWLGLLINKLYYNEDIIMIQAKEIDYVVMGGCKFYPSHLMDSLINPKHMELWFMGTRKEDIVLDIGAGIGSVCIPLAKVVKKVYAVEPLFSEELSKNIELNGLTNVEVLPTAIGLGMTKSIEFAGKKKVLVTKPFIDVIRLIEKKEAQTPNFLKCDCEGEEWYIDRTDFLRFRNLRIEWHIAYEKEVKEVELITKFLQAAGYGVIVWDGHHEPDPIFKKVLYMVASKKEE